MISFNSNVTLSGRIRCLVLDGKTKRVKKDYGWQRNMILNGGLNAALLTSGGGGRDFNTSMDAAVAGIGTTPTKDDSGVTTAVQTATTVTLAGGAFVFTNTAADAGKMIKWDSGQEAMIATITNSTTAVVGISQEVPAGQFTVFRTNQTLMATESKRTSTLLTGVGNTGTTEDMANGRITNRQTFDFSIETANITYTEVGVAANATAGLANIFSRVLLDTPVLVPQDDQLRMIYELVQTVSLFTQTPYNIVIAGVGNWTGTMMIEHYPLEGLTTSGVEQNGGSFLPSDDVIYVTADETNRDLLAIPQTATFVPAATNEYHVAGTWDTYVTNSFSRTCQFSIVCASALFTWNIISIGWFYNAQDKVVPGWSFKLDVPYVKPNTRNFKLVWQVSAGRVLV